MHIRSRLDKVRRPKRLQLRVEHMEDYALGYATGIKIKKDAEGFSFRGKLQNPLRRRGIRLLVIKHKLMSMRRYLTTPGSWSRST